MIWTEKQFSALSSGNIGKYEFLAGNDVLPEKALLEKAAIIKIFEFLPWGSELKNQTFTEKQYEKFDDKKVNFISYPLNQNFCV